MHENPDELLNIDHEMQNALFDIVDFLHVNVHEICFHRAG